MKDVIAYSINYILTSPKGLVDIQEYESDRDFKSDPVMKYTDYLPTFCRLFIF